MIFDDTLLSAHLDDELSGAVREAVEAAIAADPALAERLRLLGETKRAVSSLSRPAIGVDLAGAVLNRIERDRTAANRRPYYWIATAASLLFALAIWVQPLELGHPPKNGQDVVVTNVPTPHVETAKDETVAPVEPVGPPVIAEVKYTEPMPDANLHARDQMLQMLDRPGVRRIVIVVDAIDPAARASVNDALMLLPRKNPEFTNVKLAQGIVLDPTYPGEAEVFATVMDWPERRQLLDKLEDEFKTVIDQTVVDPHVGLQLADMSGVQMGVGRRAAGLGQGPEQEKLAIRRQPHQPEVFPPDPPARVRGNAVVQAPSGFVGPPVSTRTNEGAVPVIVWLTTRSKPAIH